MIVKNEELCIEKCLQSVKNIVDEIIIVDTGSTDKTVDICNKYNAKVYKYSWNGSFSDARNYGLKFATGDWILWLDADEELETIHKEIFDKLLNECINERLLSIHLINYIGDTVDIDKTFHIAHTRFFRNHQGFKFIYNIHETLNVHQILNSENLKNIKVLPIKVYHYGYMDSFVENKNKVERNLQILEQELLNENHTPWIEYHIASEYYRKKEYIKSFEYTNLSIERFVKNNQLPPSLVYKLKYSNLICANSIDGAWPGIELAISLYPDYVDLYFLKGIILFRKKEYNNALQVFEICIDMKENNLQHLSLKGMGSFMAWYYKGLCFEKTKKMIEAKNAFETSLKISSNYLPAKEALNKLTK
ncbi:hypothetical protein IIU_07056 [Bacillus cereus VD133]|uniref:Glycosyltransferase 2-like domain-containing protein n=1 Tax=Bacillus cereus VD133 TaxID=1053233 RepID=A0A9W5PJ31_BACCE|nr:glycosyltransferase family 2 protein [Bacillus cereus]EOO23301.1 hypothetical protein IIU_07056 [Bacillus cereus VD133]